jgi:hypothetical protein
MCFDFLLSYPVREMGGRGPPRFWVFSSGRKMGGRGPPLFSGCLSFCREGGGRGPRRHIRLFARTRKMGGAEAIPAFRFKFCVGMLLRQNEFIGGWRWEKPTQEKMTALESRQASQGSDVLVLLVRVEMFSPLFQVCESCLVGCPMTCCHNP